MKTILSALSDLSRHPMAVLIVGFALTNARSIVEHWINRKGTHAANRKLDAIHLQLNGKLHALIREIVREEKG